MADGQNHPQIRRTQMSSPFYLLVQRIILFRPDDIFLFVSVNKAPPRRRNKARSFLLSLETRFLFTLLRVLFNYNHDEMKS